ncbi:MAG: signal peptidase I [Clostridia bacterium]|nr:signal peptidase I [Clostridia bacterium]
MAEKTKKPISKAKKIYNVVSTIIVALIFVFLIVIVAMMLSQRHNGKDSKIFGYYMYDVITDSMTPTISPKSVILSKEVTNPEELQVGDIITFTAPSGQLAGFNETHRIVEIKYKDDGKIDYIITEGDKYNPDYNPDATSHTRDEWHLNPSAVKAKYVKTASFIGGLRNFLSHWYGYVVLIVLPMCIVITLFIVGYVKDKAQILKEEEAKKAGESGEKSKLDGLSEEDKKRLLEEYLKSTAGAQNPPSEIPPATADGEEQPQANAEESDSEKE